MEELISRAEVDQRIYDYAESNGLSYANMKNYILDVPPVTPTQSKWHLVKDELPRKFSFVNCTCHSLIDDREDWVIETCYIPQYPNSPYSDWGNIPMLNDGECEVIAWMYRDIPKPYKEK